MSYWIYVDDHLIDLHEVKAIGPLTTDSGGGFASKCWVIATFTVVVGGARVHFKRYKSGLPVSSTASELDKIVQPLRKEMSDLRDDLIKKVT